MKSRIRALAYAALVSILFSAPSSSRARSLPGSEGKPLAASDMACLSDWYSTVTNSCSYTFPFQIPLSTDTSGSKHIDVSGYGTSTSFRGYACDRGTTSYWASAWANFTTDGGTSQVVTVSGGLYVPSNGYMYLYANLAPNSRINTVNYNH